MAEVQTEGFGTLNNHPVTISGGRLRYRGIVWGSGPFEVQDAIGRAGLRRPSDPDAISAVVAPSGYGMVKPDQGAYGTQVEISGPLNLVRRTDLIEAGHKLASFCLDGAHEQDNG